MRIDKYLKVSRILKKRTVGKELALNERLYINDKPVKAAHEVKVGDEITIEFRHRSFKIKVLEIKDSASKQEALSMYEVIEETKKEGL